MTAFAAQALTGTKPQIYAELIEQARSLLAGETDPIANAANLSALIMWGVADLNWAGFYFLKGDTLVLGPFQGRPACVRIALGRGVCGTAALTRSTILVPDVHAFPGHIACDVNSASELVVPLIRDTKVLGVLDLDSPLKDRFDLDDQQGIENLAAIWLHASA